IYTVEFCGHIVRRPRQENGTNLGAQSSAGTVSFGLTQLQTQIVQCAAFTPLAGLDLSQGKFVYPQLTFRVHVAQKFAGRRARRSSPKQRRQETLQPAGPCTPAHPTIAAASLRVVA